MQNLSEFAKTVRELREDCPVAAVHIPPRGKNQPFNSYSLDELLELIALNLEDNTQKCFKKK